MRIRRLKDYMFICPCGGHFEVRAYDSELALKYQVRCCSCRKIPSKLVSVKLARTKV